MGIPFLIPNITLGSFGAITQVFWLLQKFSDYGRYNLLFRDLSIIIYHDCIFLRHPIINMSEFAKKHLLVLSQAVMG